MILLKNFYVDTTKSLDLILITHEVRRVLKEAKSEQGFLVVFVPNPGAALAVMESDPLLPEVRKALEPFVANQLLRCFLPKTLTLPIEQSRLSIEPRQEIFLIDYETAGRRREFRVQIHWEAKEAEEGAA